MVTARVATSAVLRFPALKITPPRRTMSPSIVRRIANQSLGNVRSKSGSTYVRSGALLRTRSFSSICKASAVVRVLGSSAAAACGASSAAPARSAPASVRSVRLVAASGVAGGAR